MIAFLLALEAAGAALGDVHPLFVAHGEMLGAVGCDDECLADGFARGAGLVRECWQLIQTINCEISLYPAVKFNL